MNGPPRTQPDRRQGPRRAEEVAMHYAEVGLIAAAIAAHEACEGVEGKGPCPLMDLHAAVLTYQEAEASLADERAVH